MRNCSGLKISTVTPWPGQGLQGPSGGRAAEPSCRSEWRWWDRTLLPPSASHDWIWGWQLHVPKLGWLHLSPKKVPSYSGGCCTRAARTREKAGAEGEKDHQ